MSEVVYLDLAQVVLLHDALLERMGDPHCPLVRGAELESALAHPRYLAQYEGTGLISQATALAVGISQSHAFPRRQQEDGPTRLHDLPPAQRDRLPRPPLRCGGVDRGGRRRLRITQRGGASSRSSTAGCTRSAFPIDQPRARRKCMRCSRPTACIRAGAQRASQWLVIRRGWPHIRPCLLSAQADPPATRMNERQGDL